MGERVLRVFEHDYRAGHTHIFYLDSEHLFPPLSSILLLFSQASALTRI